VKEAAKSLTTFSFVIGLTTGILGIVSLYVEDQSKGLFHAYQAWIAFCIIGLIPVVIILILIFIGGFAIGAFSCESVMDLFNCCVSSDLYDLFACCACLVSCICSFIVIGLGMSVNITILVMGWPYAFGEFKDHPNLG